MSFPKKGNKRRKVIRNCFVFLKKRKERKKKKPKFFLEIANDLLKRFLEISFKR